MSKDNQAGAAGKEEKKVTRRDALKTIWVGLGGLAILELGGLSLAYMQPRLTEGEFGGVITAGAVDEFPPSSVTYVPNGRFYLSRLQDGGFLAIHQRCTHLGCNVPWDQTQGAFVCPCHNSQFAPTGDVLNPPAPRPLDLFAVQIVDGMVMVDTGKTISRQNFETEQVVYA
ncbi:MAG: Rieske 2Fe-2S domain-containing protein [Chloroflexota bacterium]